MKTAISALALATALFAGAANAADLPSHKAPPPYIPPAADHDLDRVLRRS